VAAAVRLSPLSGSTSNSSRRRTRRTKPDGCAVGALAPALKGEVCRETDQQRDITPAQGCCVPLQRLLRSASNAKKQLKGIYLNELRA
uniref:hypothetical protein n=1 Tax=Massilia genomosp. 1 TaxID=2609280 RepID=UPI001C9E48AD